jgi:hypothetical protein
LRTFDAFYTHYDHVAVGDTSGAGFDEIVVSSDDHGGMINIYNSDGIQQYSFQAPVTRYDGLAVANVYGDSKCEILLARDDDDKVITYDNRGGKIREMPITTWNFKGVRYHDDTTRNDAFLVGDVVGDANPEFVMLENNNGPDSLIHVYASNETAGLELFSVTFANCNGIFTKKDAACLADTDGDGKMELLIATDSGDNYNGFKVKIYDLVTKRLVETRHWPLYTKYDGFAGGDILGTGKDQIILATDEDDIVYMSK